MFEELGVFYRGLILGLLVSVPVGPIGLLCIRRTLQRGLAVGFATGLGAALADTLFGAVAALGVTAILDFMRSYDIPIRMVGGMVLLLGAWHAWNDKPKPMVEPKDLLGKVIRTQRDYVALDIVKSIVSSFAITITNPVTLFAVLAVVASFSHVETRLDAITVITGIAAGSSLWWFSLSGGVALVRSLFNEERIIIVNRVTGIGLCAIGLWAIVSGIHRFILAH